MINLVGKYFFPKSWHPLALGLCFILSAGSLYSANPAGGLKIEGLANNGAIKLSIDKVKSGGPPSITTAAGGNTVDVIITDDKGLHTLHSQTGITWTWTTQPGNSTNGDAGHSYHPGNKTWNGKYEGSTIYKPKFKIDAPKQTQKNIGGQQITVLAATLTITPDDANAWGAMQPTTAPMVFTLTGVNPSSSSNLRSCRLTSPSKGLSRSQT